MTVWKWLEQGEYRGYCEKRSAKSVPFLESSNEHDLGLFNLCIEASWSCILSLCLCSIDVGVHPSLLWKKREERDHSLSIMVFGMPFMWLIQQAYVLLVNACISSYR